MHKSSFHKMKNFRDTYMKKENSYVVLDVGGHGEDFAASQYTNSDEGSYCGLFAQENWKYETLNPANDPGVDFYVEEPYNWKNVPNEYADIIISGQTFEHVEFFWITMLEIRRVLKPGGLICIIAPSGGDEHKYPLDCYRFYADGMAALARSTGLEILEVRTDYVYDGVPPHYILGIDETTQKTLYDSHAGARFGDSLLIAKKRDSGEKFEALFSDLHAKHLLVLDAVEKLPSLSSSEKRVINRLPVSSDPTSFLVLRLYVDLGQELGVRYVDHSLSGRGGKFASVFDLSAYSSIHALRLDILTDSLVWVSIKKADTDNDTVSFVPVNALSHSDFSLISNDQAHFSCATIPSNVTQLSLEIVLKSGKTTFGEDALVKVGRSLDNYHTSYRKAREEVSRLKQENSRLRDELEQAHSA